MANTWSMTQCKEENTVIFTRLRPEWYTAACFAKHVCGRAMKEVFLVGAGGFIGSILRYLSSLGAQRVLSESFLPYGTFAVNMLGCFVIGLLAGLADSRHLLSPEVRLVLMVGLLGGFTTYSTFGYDSLAIIKNTGFSGAALYIGLHIIVGVALVWLGHEITA
jgi:CrcB protein